MSRSNNIMDRQEAYVPPRGEDFIDYEAMKREEEYEEWLDNKRTELDRCAADIDCLQRLLKEASRRYAELEFELRKHQ